MICRKYSFHKLTPFLQENNVLDDADSDKVIFFEEIHLFLQLN
jgi:hypothetical protein